MQALHSVNGSPPLLLLPTFIDVQRSPGQLHQAWGKGILNLSYPWLHQGFQHNRDPIQVFLVTDQQVLESERHDHAHNVLNSDT